MTDPPAEIPELPAERSIDRLVSLLEPFSRVTRPRLYGVEHLPTDGSLLVGNHTIYGFLDLPFVMAEIWKHRRLAIRGLGEHAHYAVPIWRELLTVGGMVRGTRDGSPPQRGQEGDGHEHPDRCLTLRLSTPGRLPLGPAGQRRLETTGRVATGGVGLPRCRGRSTRGWWQRLAW
jgi:Acyltransferase